MKRHLEYNKNWRANKRRTNRKKDDLEQFELLADEPAENQEEGSFSWTDVAVESDEMNGTDAHPVSVESVPKMDRFPSESESEGDVEAVSDEWEEVDAEDLGDDECPDEDAQSSLENMLIEWINSYSISHNATDGLLKILSKAGHNLPLTARTLLGPVKTVDIKCISGMQYIYFGVKEQLEKCFESYPVEDTLNLTHLKISLNVDGVPLFKSSRASLWPVLCSFVDLQPPKVFPLVLTLGPNKPTSLAFLEDVVRDLRIILEDGVDIGQRKLQISVQCIVCDAPARSFVKGTKLFSGYCGCDKCEQHGFYDGKRVVYNEISNLVLRTNDSFRTKTNPEHHLYDSPLLALNIDMIKCFPIDYMHQVCLGVTKRLLLLWMKGPRQYRLSYNQIAKINDNLMQMRKYIPKVFARKPRSLVDVSMWKATEFRQFLLYTGKIALKGVIESDKYKHFLALSVGISILVSRTLSHLQPLAKELLEYFVSAGKLLYSDAFLVYNVHTLLHLADEANQHGDLDSCSAFRFENENFYIKKCVRSGKSPLVQIARRLDERMNACSSVSAGNSDTVIATSSPNNIFVSGTTCIEVIAEKLHSADQYFCKVYKATGNFFEEPCESIQVGVFKVKLAHFENKVFYKSDLKAPGIRIPLSSSKALVMSVLHAV